MRTLLTATCNDDFFDDALTTQQRITRLIEDALAVRAANDDMTDDLDLDCPKRSS